MSRKPPPISGRETVKVLEKAGFLPPAKRKSGSHIVLTKQEGVKIRKVPVPDHKEVSIGTLRSILKQAGLTAEEFEELRRKKR